MARLTERICVESQGNPFVVVEMLHALRAGADADASGGLPLPERVRHLVARRLERLSAAARQLVATAAVIGRDCGFGAAPTRVGLGESDAIEALEELVRRRIFIAACEGFDFSRDRIREVARRAVLPPRRRILHRQVAETLEALGTAAFEPNPAAVGYHYREAEQWDRALPSLRRAGLEALARSAYREAAVMMAQAVEAQARLPAGSVTPEDVFDLRLRAGRSTQRETSPDLGKRIRDEQSLAETLGDRRRLARPISIRVNPSGPSTSIGEPSLRAKRAWTSRSKSGIRDSRNGRTSSFGLVYA